MSSEWAPFLAAGFRQSKTQELEQQFLFRTVNSAKIDGQDDAGM